MIGTITDATGAVIPGATVTIKEAATGRTVNTQTNDAGQYVLSALPIGKYHLDVKQEGFKTSFADFSLEVSQVLEVSFETGDGLDFYGGRSLWRSYLSKAICPKTCSVSLRAGTSCVPEWKCPSST